MRCCSPRSLPPGVNPAASCGAALLCWEAIFAPLPAAFASSLADAPLDLKAAPGVFAARRCRVLAALLARIEAGAAARGHMEPHMEPHMAPHMGPQQPRLPPPLRPRPRPPRASARAPESRAPSPETSR